MDIKDYITAEQVAHMIGYSRSYVYQMIRLGKLPFTRYGTKVLFNEQDIRDWMINRLSTNNVHDDETK